MAHNPIHYRPYPTHGMLLIMQREWRAQVRGLRTWQGVLLQMVGPLAYVWCLAAVMMMTESRVVPDMLTPLLLLGFSTLLCLVLVMLNTAVALVRERQQQTMDLLLLTPLSREAILWGKLLLAVWPMTVANLACLIGLVLLVSQISKGEHLLLLLLILFNCSLAVLGAATSLFAATVSSRIDRAIGLAGLILLPVLIFFAWLTYLSLLASSAISSELGVIIMLLTLPFLMLLIGSVLYVTAIQRLEMLDK